MCSIPVLLRVRVEAEGADTELLIPARSYPLLFPWQIHSDSDEGDGSIKCSAHRPQGCSDPCGAVIGWCGAPIGTVGPPLALEDPYWYCGISIGTGRPLLVL